MKSLWSKAGQAHRCGCRACKTAVTGGAGQRVTTPRRKPTFAELFTAAYSSVFASAAVVDAIRKEERRKDLDQQLEDAKRELAELREQNDAAWPHSENMKTRVEAIIHEYEQHESPYPNNLNPETVEASVQRLTDTQMEELWDSLRSICLTRPYFKEVFNPAALPESEARKKAQGELYGLSMKSEKHRIGLGSARLKQALAKDEEDLGQRQREPLDDLHMNHLSADISHLVQQIMGRANNIAGKEATQPSPSFDDAARLLAEGYPRYSFRDIDAKKAQAVSKKRNQANRAAIHNPKLGIKETVGRVCYNLLVSEYPPDMHTLNTLVAAFDEHHDIRYRDYSEAVIWHFFNKSKFVPTHTTYATVLRHYRLTGKFGQFLRSLYCITGMDQITGAKYRRRHISELEHNVYVRKWANKSNVAPGTEYLWEKAPLNQLMIEEILKGLLRFNMLEHAVSFFFSCVNVGVRLTEDAIKLLVDQCVYRMDWRAALLLVQELAKRPETWDAILAERTIGTVSLISARVCSLLDMVGLLPSNKSISDEALESLGLSRGEIVTLVEDVTKSFEATNSKPIYAQLKSRIHGDANSHVASQSRFLQMESLEKELVRSRQVVKSLESKLIGPELPMDFRLSALDYVSATALVDGEQLQNDVSQIIRMIEQRKLASLKKVRSKAISTQKALERKEDSVLELRRRGLASPQRGTLEGSTSMRLRSPEQRQWALGGLQGALLSRMPLSGTRASESW